jgi:hypothetical protein
MFSVLFEVSLTKFDAGDLGNGVGFIGRFEITAEQAFFFDGLFRKLGVDTR